MLKKIILCSILCLIVSNIKKSYSENFQDCIEIFPSIMNLEIFTTELGQVYGYVNIDEDGVNKKYIYYDSLLDSKQSAANPNRLKSYELLLLSKTIEMTDTRIKESFNSVQVIDETYKEIEGYIKTIDISKQLYDALSNITGADKAKKYAMKIEKNVTNTIEVYFLSNYGKKSNEYKFLFPIIKELISFTFKVFFASEAGQNLIYKKLNFRKPVQTAFSKALQKGLLYFELFYKSAYLANVNAANIMIYNENLKMSIELFISSFINEYIYDFDCNIEKMAKKYVSSFYTYNHSGNISFWDLWNNAWESYYGIIDPTIQEFFSLNKYRTQIFDAARRTLDLIEKYGNGGNFRMFGYSIIENNYSKNKYQMVKTYEFKNYTNAFFILSNDLDKIDYVIRIEPSNQPRISIKTKLYRNKKVTFSDKSESIKDIIKLNINIDIDYYTYFIRWDGKKETQSKTINICLPVSPIFPDIKGNEWFAKYVAHLYKKEIIQGHQNFNPNNNITGGEFLKMFTFVAYSEGALYKIHSFNDDSIPFSKYALFIIDDIKSKGLDINRGVDSTILFQYNRDDFLNSNITRKEVAAFLYYFYCFNKYYSSDSEIEMCGEIDENGWDKCSNILKEVLLVEGNMGSFRPEGYVTRAEAAKLLYKIDSGPKIFPKVEISPVNYDDLNLINHFKILPDQIYSPSILIDLTSE